MRYRWGFEEGGVFTECLPILEDESALDFAPQTNEVFYRAKLNGTLSFRFEFDAILAKGYNYTHIVVLQCYNDSDNTWKECWRGRFCLTDCEIDYDTNTINVQPETLDRYTAILDALENEYNLVKLAPDKQYVDILIRPCLQVYSLNNNKITNYVGNSWWESSCDAISYTDTSQLGKFRAVGDYFAVQITWGSGTYAGKTINYTGKTNNNHYLTGKIYNGDTVIGTDTIHVARSDQQGDDISLLQITKDNVYQCSVTFSYHGAGLEPISTWVNPQGDAAEVNAQWYDIYNRILVNTDLNYIDIGNDRLIFYDLSADDMAGVNLNYNKCIGINYNTIQVDLYDATQVEPTQWGMSYYEDRYFKKLPDVPPIHYSPVGIDLWKYISLWWYPQTDAGEEITYKQICDVMAKKQRIADCYTLSSTITKLMEKAGWTGSIISKVLNGTNDYIGDSFIPVIAPRSNVISSYYSTPAQNAPISLAMCFNMLKNVYKVYWYIDDNNDLHVEHISYFRNGLAYYDDQTGLLVDLEARLHTDTKSNKVFCQNKIKFDKQDMPETFTFGWADVQTKPFDGWPIKCLDAYVQKGMTDEHSEGKFDSDVDYVLTSPSDVTKDGFFLFAVPANGGSTDWSLKVQPVRITDEEGETYDIEIQNADAAFVKIHESFWRYDMPCEQLNVNNANTVALTTGNFKSQSIEYADTIMADLLTDIANCIKVIRTQQGDGHIKSMSVNLNSLHTKTDLLFNFIGRWYYLRGTALGASIDIIINNVLMNIEVSNNSFLYRYQEPITQLDFHAADVVSVDFSDCDKLDGLTSADNMFDGCEELIAVDFGHKTFGAVISADYMFRGCVNLTTLLCPNTSSWQPDIDFSDCPLLTEASLYEFIDYLYEYNSGVHTITPNTTMWNALDGAVQADMITKATAKGWTIAIPAQYSITGQSAANTVYVTINGTALEIPVTAGLWSYDYNAAITSISFEGDNDVTDIDFSLSDGLAGVTSLDNAFKDCGGLTTVDFSNCDLSNVASAADAFANCSALYELIIPQGTWQPDIDLSASVMPKAEMLNVIDGLYDYTSGTHTITFNSTIWDAMSVADQQIVFDAADAKGWTTNAVAVVYYIRGTSSNVNGQETFTMAFINDNSLTPSVRETITCNVDGNGNWEFSYIGKKLYDTRFFANNKTTLLTIDFIDADDFSKLIYLSQESSGMFKGCTNLTTVNFGNRTFENVEVASVLFRECTSLTTCDLSHATFTNLTDAHFMFDACSLQNIDLSSATFANVTNAQGMFKYSSALNGTINLSSATFASATTTYDMFYYCYASIIDMRNATFGSISTAYHMFYRAENVVTLRFDKTNFTSSSNIQGIFRYTNAMTTFVCTVSNCNVNPSASGAAVLMNLGESPLTYQSMLNFANWLSDKTGYSASTITFKATYWNALTADEKNTLDGIISGKNWTRAIA